MILNLQVGWNREEASGLPFTPIKQSDTVSVPPLTRRGCEKKTFPKRSSAREKLIFALQINITDNPYHADFIGRDSQWFLYY
jgi:hypothetical protein